MGLKINILKGLISESVKYGARKTIGMFKGGADKMPEETTGSPSGKLNKEDVKASGKVLLWASISALIGAASQNIDVIKNVVTQVFPEPYNLLVSTVVVNVVAYLGKRFMWNNTEN